MIKGVIMKNNNYLIDYKSIYEFLFILLEQYRDLFEKKNGNYKDYDEIYKNFIKINFWYLNYLYINFYIAVDLSSKDWTSNFLSILRIYSECNPKLKDLNYDFENPECIKEDDLKKIDLLFRKDHRLISHLYDDLYFYHYTNVDALKKILKGHNLKFSNLDRYTNDKSEGKYLDKYLDSFLNVNIENCKEINSNQDIYSFSLSCQEDDVAQWARYAKYEGVCLVFSCKALFQYINVYLKKAKGSFFVCPLKYTKFEKIPTRDMAAEISLYNLLNIGYSSYNQLRFMFKHISFESEREYRLYFCNDKTKNFIDELEIFSFTSDGSLMMDLGQKEFPNIITNIIFGPKTAEKDKTEIKNLLSCFDYKKIECINSCCPIR